jgi:predicted nuclease of predicted toxin-antitoxin system
VTRRLLVDECVNKLIVLPPFLSLIECVFVADRAGGAPDVDVIALARREGFLLLTEDNDFGRLIFAERLPPPPGVILVTMPNRTPVERAARVREDAAYALAEAEGGLVVIDHEGRRRRPFPNDTTS